MATRSLLSKVSSLSLLSSRSFLSSSSSLLRLRPLIAADLLLHRRLPAIAAIRCFSSQPTTSSLRDSSPNWSNRPPKETILLDGCDFEHWLVVMEPPPGPAGNPDVSRDEIIDSYIKTLAMIVGSEEEARQKIYSVSTRHYFAFGCLVSEELSYKIKELPKVRWVLPDSYLDVKNKDYGGEPFIDGQAVPYDPKYHEEWVRNNARANERSRRNDRPRNFDRSRNFERRRENMQNFQNREAPPMPNQEFQNRDGSPMPPRDAPPMPNSHNAMPQPPNRDFNAMPNRSGMAPPPNVSGPPNSYQNQMPNPQSSYMPGSRPGYQGGGPGYQGGNPGGFMPSGPGYQGGGPGYQGGNPGGNMPGGPGYQGGGPGYQGGGPGYQGGNPGGNMPGGRDYEGGNPPYQGGNPGYPGGVNQGAGHSQGGSPNYEQGGSGYGGPAYQGRDVPGRDYQ
ncbi:multiple organellar RNA editing factor 8, chloroplastic/mitochondrial-like [Typha latifolia]|uniref:multiple organellar RNA editing factor 8, chloroplastic/mitochondrial-like n=1 Tax=Typha latifolia TaxID=4733 RepID=UPI003C2BDF80